MASSAASRPGKAASRADLALPNLIVIGAQKCGTSSLHYYLDLHPEIQMSSPKELVFFCNQPVVGTAAPPGWFNVGKWHRGVDWYASHFSPEAAVRGESSPSYTAPAFPDVAEKMHAVVPDARLIYLVRNPVARMLSEYAMRRASGVEAKSVDVALSVLGNPYLERTRYHSLLRPFVERFGAERILVVATEELELRQREALREIFEFLGVDPGFWSAHLTRKRNVTGRGVAWRTLKRLRRSRLGRRLVETIPEEAQWRVKRLVSTRRRHREEVAPLPDALRGHLNDQLRGEVKLLRELTGKRFEAWEL